MKTTEIKAELSKEQLEYLQALGYYMRATPAELLVALAFGAVDAAEAMEGQICDAFSRDLVNYVVERRVPSVDPDVIGQIDSGKFTCAARRDKREKLAREGLGQRAATAPDRPIALPAAAGEQQKLAAADAARDSIVGLQPCPGLRGSIFRDSLGRDHDLTREKPISSKEAARDPRMPDSPRRVLELIRARRLYPVLRDNARVIRIYPSAIADYWARQCSGARASKP